MGHCPEPDCRDQKPFSAYRASTASHSSAFRAPTTIGSIHARATKPGFASYAASKAGLLGLTRAMAVDLGGQVRVNAIQPAAVDTPMLRDGFADNPDALQALGSCHPIGRIADAAEIARVAVFLASDEASFITGSAVDVDGGIGARLHDPV